MHRGTRSQTRRRSTSPTRPPTRPNPDYVFLIQGAGPIPNSAFSLSTTAAHLAVTTTFPITRCEVNLITGVFDCGPGTPSTFDLTWEVNGFGIITEKTQRKEIFGPVTTRFAGEFTIRTAVVNGSFDAFSAVDSMGNILDTKSKTVIREVTVQASP